MYQFSDSDTSDSDDGIRFKTATTRHKHKRDDQRSRLHCTGDDRREKERRGRSSRSRSRDRTKHRSKNRSRSPKRNNHKDKKHKSRSRRSGSKSIEREVLSKTSRTSRSQSLSSRSCEVKSCGPSLSKIHQLSEESLENTDAIAIPSHLLPNNIDYNSMENCGPALSVCGSIQEDAVCGPALPPHLLSKKSVHVQEENKCIGPFIPEHLRKQLAENTEKSYLQPNEASEDEEQKTNDEDDVHCYGPLPADMQKMSRAHLALEERALQMKLDQLTPQSTNDTGREEWMLELPTVQAANLGLGPRQFRGKAGPDLSDRSSWTNTPNSKNRTIPDKGDDLQRTAERNALLQRDEEQEALAKKARKKNKRDKSLLEQHQDKLKAKKKDDQQGLVRRPFNRDIDLKVNQFDDAQKKSIMKKAQLLDNRFSQGQSKFL